MLQMPHHASRCNILATPGQLAQQRVSRYLGEPCHEETDHPKAQLVLFQPGWSKVGTSLTSDSLGAHDDVVEVPLLSGGRSSVPIILEEHRVDAVGAQGPDPGESGLASLQVAVEPVFEHAV